MLLENKTAIVYGAGGGIGRGVATTFAREGATVFLTGRTEEKLAAVAKEITSAGGTAEVAVVDALDEQAVNEHVRAVVGKTGGLDVSINLISHGDEGAGGYIQGVPIVDQSPADFNAPVTKAVLGNLVTAQAAAREMAKRGSGAILTLTNAGAFGAQPLMGSTGVAAAAIESFARYLASEVGPQGVRVLGIRIAAVPELFPPDLHTDVFDKDSGGLDTPNIVDMLANMAMLRRTTTLAQVADVAAFLASDRAGGITCSFTNVTAGLVTDI